MNAQIYISKEELETILIERFQFKNVASASYQVGFSYGRKDVSDDLANVTLTGVTITAMKFYGNNDL